MGDNNEKKGSGQENIQRYMLKTYFVIACISVFVGAFCVYLCLCVQTVQPGKYGYVSEKIRLTMDQAWRDVEDVCGRLCQDGLVKQVLGYSSEPSYHGNDVLDVQTLMEAFNENIDSCKEVLEIYLLNRTIGTMLDSGNIYHGTECEAVLASIELDNKVLEAIKMAGNLFFLHVVQTGLSR